METTARFRNMKVKKVKIGYISTTINHQVRSKLGITCDEYALLDHIANLYDSKERYSTTNCRLYLCFEEDEQKVLWLSLKDKNLISGKREKFEVSKKWYDAFPDIDKEFESFWKPFDESLFSGMKGFIEDKKLKWNPGPKQKAKERFEKVRRKYSFDYLMDNKKYYFLTLNLPKHDYRQPVGCAVFIGPDKQYYLNNWKEEFETDAKEIVGLHFKAGSLSKNQFNEIFDK